jgi:hypothetical protein
MDLLEVSDGEDGDVLLVEASVWYRAAYPIELDRLRGQVELEKVIVRV